MYVQSDQETLPAPALEEELEYRPRVEYIPMRNYGWWERFCDVGSWISALVAALFALSMVTQCTTSYKCLERHSPEECAEFRDELLITEKPQ